MGRYQTDTQNNLITAILSNGATFPEHLNNTTGHGAMRLSTQLKGEHQIYQFEDLGNGQNVACTK